MTTNNTASKVTGASLSKWLRGRCDDLDIMLSAGVLCPHCARPLQVSVVRHLDERGLELICQNCHEDILLIRR
jgi:hypothetical protein